jgi:hypothetical protein
LFVHSRNNTVDLLNPVDLTLKTNLDVDGKRMIVVQEFNKEFIFFGCEGGAMFTFNFATFERIKKGTA